MLGTRGDSTSLGRVRRARVVGSALVVVLGATWLSACDSNAASPPPMETQTRSPSTTSSPTPTAPTLPAEAKGATEASAKAFVRHYIDVTNYAMATGDLAHLRALRRDACSTCQAMEGRISQVYGNGGRLEGEGWSVLTIDHVVAPDSGTAIVAVGISIAPQRSYESSDAPPSASAASRGHLEFTLKNSSAEWQVVRLDATQ